MLIFRVAKRGWLPEKSELHFPYIIIESLLKAYWPFYCVSCVSYVSILPMHRQFLGQLIPKIQTNSSPICWTLQEIDRFWSEKSFEWTNKNLLVKQIDNPTTSKDWRHKCPIKVVFVREVWASYIYSWIGRDQIYWMNSCEMRWKIHPTTKLIKLNWIKLFSHSLLRHNYGW